MVTQFGERVNIFFDIFIAFGDFSWYYADEGEANNMTRVATFAMRIKEYRTANNLTLAEMEGKIGLPAQTINRYELGQRVPKIDTSIEIADALRINPLWLQGYDVDIELPALQTENGPISPERQALLDAVKDMDEDTVRAVLDVVRSVKKLRGE